MMNCLFAISLRPVLCVIRATVPKIERFICVVGTQIDLLTLIRPIRINYHVD